MTSRGFKRAWAVAVAVACALAAPVAAHAANTDQRVVRLGAAPRAGHVSLALPLRADVSGLERFAAAVSTPGSPRYGRYESIPRLARRFGAPATERARVLGYLRRAGATGVKVDVTGLFADATLTVARAQRLFGAPLGEFHTARAGRYVAPESPARVPAPLRPAVTGVIGLDTQPLFGAGHVRTAARARWPRAAAVAAQETSSGYDQRTGVASGCAGALAQQGFTPNQYLTAYGYAPLQAAGLEGQGERVALIEIDGFKYSDLRAFSRCFGLATPAINGFGVGLRKPLAPGGETTLDLEVLDAAAPRLKAVDVYESRPSAVDVLHSLTAPLTNPGSKPNVISASLGSCEEATLQTIGRSGMRAVEGSLALAAASGISVLASSGDDGSSACLAADGRPLPGRSVSYPASSPFVTGVGGTNITLDATNQITNQVVWNDTPTLLGAGGGGISDVFRRPSYQNGFAPTGRRAVPDVSMLADIQPGYEIYCTARTECVDRTHRNPWAEVGGTSAAAPLLAGGLALVDERLRRSGRQDLGLANGLLYGIARSPQSASVLSDVVQGDNDVGALVYRRPTGCCTAGPGYDDASGLGSVNLSGLAAVAGALVPRVVSVRLSLPRQRRPVAAEHLLARVSCSGRCLAGAYARIRVGRTRRVITQRSRVLLLRRRGRRTIRIPLSRGTLRRLRAALAQGRRITATVYGTIQDPAGNVEARTRGRVLPIRG